MRNENEENEVERLVETAAHAIVARVGCGLTVEDARPLARQAIECRIARGADVQDWACSPGGFPMIECINLGRNRRAENAARQIEQHEAKTRAALSPVGVYGEEEAARYRYDAGTALGYFWSLAGDRWRKAYNDLAAALHSNN